MQYHNYQSLELSRHKIFSNQFLVVFLLQYKLKVKETDKYLKAVIKISHARA